MIKIPFSINVDAVECSVEAVNLTFADYFTLSIFRIIIFFPVLIIFFPLAALFYILWVIILLILEGDGITFIGLPVYILYWIVLILMLPFMRLIGVLHDRFIATQNRRKRRAYENSIKTNAKKNNK